MVRAQEDRMTRYRLLQARIAGDPVREEEQLAFAARLEVDPPAIVPFDLLTEEINLQTVTEGVDAVLVGGSGAYSVLHDEVWLRQFIDVMGAIAEAGFPTFASCFGFQAMVLALGGEIRSDKGGAEVGSFEVFLADAGFEDPLFRHLPERFVAQQGHKVHASRIPTQTVNLARSKRCAYQAIRVVGKPVYATQFHAELTREDNLTRFRRYFDMYSNAYGSSRAHEMLDAFRPSPEANGLLRRFREQLEQGTLTGS
jgi:GMP synthase (glutamine-hydrolysing)